MATLEDAYKQGGALPIMMAMGGMMPGGGPLAGPAGLPNLMALARTPGMLGPQSMLNRAPPRAQQDPIAALGSQYNIQGAGGGGGKPEGPPTSNDVNSFVSALLGNVAPSTQPRGS